LTLIIGAHLNHYTIIAAGTRVAASLPSFRHAHHDGNHKIAMCRDGLVAASGYPGILNIFKKELLRDEMISVTKIKQIIADTVFPNMESYNRIFPHLGNHPRFLISHIPGPGDENPLLALCMTDPQGKFRKGIVNGIFTIMPADLNRSSGNAYEEYLRDNLIMFSGNDSDEGYFDALLSNLRRNIILISRCFVEMAGMSALVSHEMDIAALHLSGDIFYAYGQSAVFSYGELKGMLLIQDHPTTRYLTPDLYGSGSAVPVIPE